MAIPREQGTPPKCDSLIRTRRLNQTQSFLLEQRLKVLDCKKSQKNAEFHVEKHSLRKQMEEIRSVRKNLGISVERRKLLRSQGYTIDTRSTNNDDAVVIKKYSMPELTNQRTSNRQNHSLNNGEIVKGLTQFKLQETGEMETGNGCEEPPKTDLARSRARHQFRIIEPPSRPGSRRNFVQLSNDKLKELKKKGDEESGETLLDSNIKLDYRGKILSPRLVKSLMNNSQFDVDQGEEHFESCESCDGSISQKKKNTIKEIPELRPSSAPQLIPLCSEENQAFTESGDSGDATLRTKESTKLISKSCESLDHMTEVCTPDSYPDLNGSASGDVISYHREDKLTAVSGVTQPSQLAHEPMRKHATCGSRSPIRLAFVEPLKGTSNNHQATFKKRSSAQMEMGGNNAENSPHVQLSKKAGPVRRVTLPSKFFSGVNCQESVKSHGKNSGRESKRMSVGSQSMNIRKSKVTAFSSDPERSSRLTGAVTYAYDARPGRSLCKGYVTMQMTVKGKQVKVHIPKFPSDSDSQPVLERARKKVADDRLHDRMLHEKEKSEDLQKVSET